MDFLICQNTQCPEKYICINEECYKAEKKQIQCYQCLTKCHLSKNKEVKHMDDFIELDQFINEVRKKQIKRHTVIQMIIQQAQDFSKKKIQEVQLCRNVQLIKNATEKIEGEIAIFIKNIYCTYQEHKFTLPYKNSQHSFYLKFYFENENIYQEDLNQRLVILYSSIEKYMQSLDLDIGTTIKRSYQKIEVLEKQITQFSKQYLYNKLQLLIIILLFPYLFYLQSNQFEIIKFQKQQELIIQRHDYLIQAMLPLNEKFNKMEQKHDVLIMNQSEDISVLNETLVQMMDSVQKLKLRFDTFKSSSTSSLEKDRIYFQTYVEAIQNNITQIEVHLKKQIQEMSLILDTIIKQTESQSLTQKQARLEQFKRFEQVLDQMKKKNVIQKIVQLKNYVYSLKFRHLIKIHLNLPKKTLNKFELIYDELFNKPILVYTMMQIQQKVFKHDGDNPLVCLGGLNIMNLEEIDLIACDFANDIFRPTFDNRKAIKSKHGNIYWYQEEESSFGFAPNENILLLLCDAFDEESEFRFSYWYNIKTLSGGRRLGKDLYLENSTEHKLQIYLLNPPFQ